MRSDMYVVLGATGQIGSILVSDLIKKGRPVRAVGRDLTRLKELERQGAEVVTADLFDVSSLKTAFKGGDVAFLLTPEDPRCERCLDKVHTMLDNYRAALLSSGIGRIVGLSSMGAQNGLGAGGLEASHMLERSIGDMDVEAIFVRPAYYYSNWIGYLDTARSMGILPTFFPPEMKLPMVAPPDVAAFLSDVMIGNIPSRRVYEVLGPRPYSTADIAGIFSTVLDREVIPLQVLPKDWQSILEQGGFSRDAARNLALMTAAVIEGKTEAETSEPTHLPTDFRTYLEGIVKK